MPEFKEGQLVAVRYGSSWEPRTFRRKDDDGLWCMDFLSHGASPYAQEDVEPAEAVWPEIFIGLDRGAADQAVQALDQVIDALEMESDLVQRLRKQVAWLCQELAHSDDLCPTFLMTAPCDHECAKCWEEASLKAVEDANNG